MNSLVYVTKSLYMYYLTLFSRSLYTYVYYAFVYMSVCLIRYLPPQAMTIYLSFGKTKNFYPLIRSSALSRGENRKFKQTCQKKVNELTTKTLFVIFGHFCMQKCSRKE